MRQKVGWGDEAYIVAASFLQQKHLLRKLFNGQRFPEALLADLVILAEAARKMAVAEKNGARAAGAGQNRLFAKVGDGFSSGYLSACLTFSARSPAAVNSAVPGAQATGGKEFP